MGSDAAFIGVMVGTWSGLRALCFMDGNQAKQAGGGRKTGTELMRPRRLAVPGLSVPFDPARPLTCILLCTFCFIVAHTAAIHSARNMVDGWFSKFATSTCEDSGRGKEQKKQKTKTASPLSGQAVEKRPFGAK